MNTIHATTQYVIFRSALLVQGEFVQSDDNLYTLFISAVYFFACFHTNQCRMCVVVHITILSLNVSSGNFTAVTPRHNLPSLGCLKVWYLSSSAYTRSGLVYDMGGGYIGGTLE